MNIIAAVSDNNVIGKDNKIPWDYPGDLKYFKLKTENQIVIMGRKTFESLGCKALKNRFNIVVSKEILPLQYENIFTFKSFDDAVEEAKLFGKNLKKEIWFIGGSFIYHKALDICNKMYITAVPDLINGDNLVYFPSVNFSKWKLNDNKIHPFDNNLNIFEYERQ